MPSDVTAVSAMPDRYAIDDPVPGTTASMTFLIRNDLPDPPPPPMTMLNLRREWCSNRQPVALISRWKRNSQFIIFSDWCMLAVSVA